MLGELWITKLPCRRNSTSLAVEWTAWLFLGGFQVTAGKHCHIAYMRAYFFELNTGNTTSWMPLQKQSV